MPEGETNRAMLRWVGKQDAERGPWESQRRKKMPDPPFPDPDNPMLKYLLEQAVQQLTTGDETINNVLTHLAVHAWYEGGIEGYDRGQRDARL